PEARKVRREGVEGDGIGGSEPADLRQAKANPPGAEAELGHGRNRERSTLRGCDAGGGESRAP
ncbi:MAG: hypothetical protein RLZZ447_932, partial [Verrucomicrobiota bacterium]